MGDNRTIIGKVGQAARFTVERPEHRDRATASAVAGKIVQQTGCSKAPATWPHGRELETFQAADAHAVVVVREVDRWSDLHKAGLKSWIEQAMCVYQIWFPGLHRFQDLLPAGFGNVPTGRPFRECDPLSIARQIHLVSKS